MFPPPPSISPLSLEKAGRRGGGKGGRERGRGHFKLLKNIFLLGEVGGEHQLNPQGLGEKRGVGAQLKLEVWWWWGAALFLL